MVAKIVVVNGCSRRARCASLGATVTIVPTGLSLAYRLATVLSIANFNMHCGMDGWGRPYDYLAAIAALDADIVVLEETWTAEGDGGDGQAERAARHLGYQVVTQVVGEGRRIRPQPDADHRWIAQPSMRDANRALFIDGVRPLNRGVQSLTRWQEAEAGTMAIAVLVRPELPIEASRVLHLHVLKADRMRRAAIVVDLTVDDRPISVGGIHMSHLLHGSPRHFAELRRWLRTEARPDAVVAGDMNSWGPPVRFFMRGWRPTVIGRSWPSWRPHSQIDHILVRGAVRPLAGVVFPHSGSDHRPIRAELEIG
jgi:endonuclease/exonuclease/phosphatase family metal-dependent hydrolase